MSIKTRCLVAAAALLAVASTSTAAPVANNNASWAALAAISSSSRRTNINDCTTADERRADRIAGRAIVGNRCVGRASGVDQAHRAGGLWGGGIFPVGGFIVAEIMLYLFTDTELHGHPRGVSPG